MKKLQYGFTVVEGLLILVIAGIIGSTGWYVWNSQKQADNAYSKVSNSTAAPSLKSSTKTTKTDSNKGYFVIKEWGIKISYSGSDSFLYKTSTDSSQVWKVSITSKQLLAADSKCTADEGAIITRYSQAEIEEMNKQSEEYAGAPGTTLKKVGDYTYVYRGFTDNSKCSPTDTKAQQLKKQTNEILYNSMSKLEAI